MTPILQRSARRVLPRVAVLTPHWGGAGEAAWALRQVAGALALSAEVHVLTPQGHLWRRYFDGVVEVHEAASANSRQSAARRDLLVSLMSERIPLDSHEQRRLTVLLEIGQEQWEALAKILDALHPDLVVLADYREMGAARLVATVCPDAPVISVPLADRFAVPSDPTFAPSLERAAGAVVFSEAEGALVRAVTPEIPVHCVGLPLAANPSVQREPNTFVGNELYALVLTGVPWRSPGWPTTLCSLLTIGFPRHRIVVGATDRLVLLRRGEELQAVGVERGTDLLRLVAWSTMTVDLQPGALFARRPLEALLYGSPVVVPATSRARQHAEIGACGLWFEGTGDLAWCVEAVFDPTTRDALSRQGRTYVQDRYTGTTPFVERISRAVTAVLGVTVPSSGSP